MVPRSGMAISVCGKGWQSGFQRHGSIPPANEGVDLCGFVCTYVGFYLKKTYEGIRENSVEEKQKGKMVVACQLYFQVLPALNTHFVLTNYQ